MRESYTVAWMAVCLVARMESPMADWKVEMMVFLMGNYLGMP